MRGDTVISNMECPVKITQKRGMTIFPASFVKNGNFAKLTLTLKMLLSREHNTRNGLRSQNHMKMR